MVEGIPDLRVSVPAWVEVAVDTEMARNLVASIPPEDVEGSVRWVFASREGWDPKLIERRTRQVLQGPDRLETEVRRWLTPLTETGEGFLDLGCGAGMLLAAAARQDKPGIGIDVSLVWLVVAQRMIRAAGGDPVLAAAMSEALPLADESLPGVALLDVIEHVGDQAKTLSEVSRVTAPGGALAMATPNRFSLTAEPHVYVWGVGWVPRRWQKAYVKWRSGQNYEFCRLLSPWELSRMIRRHTQFEARSELSPVSEFELANFPRRRAVVARLYNRIVSWKSVSWLLLAVCPFFWVKGRRRG